MTFSATYSPDDNKLRLYASARLDADTYARVKAAGFKWAPKQELFVAPAWTPEREDLCVELAGEVEDEDKSLVERAEERADRFEDYSASRLRDSEAASATAHRIGEMTQGQPILVGHHSEKGHRAALDRMWNASAKASAMWRTSAYWTQRAAGSIRAAKYKERPNVRARRIKGLEADLRKQERHAKDTEACLLLWSFLFDDTKWKPRDENGLRPSFRERAIIIANRDHVSMAFPLAEYPRTPPASQYEGTMTLWDALGGNIDHAAPEERGFITPEQARELATARHRSYLARCNRWIEHYQGRLAYERGMLAEQGGTVAMRTPCEVGGGVYCWTTRRRGAGAYSTIVKVNKVSVTVWDNWGNGGKNFTRTIPFDSLGAIVTRAEVAAAEESGRLHRFEDGTGFYIEPAATAAAGEENENAGS